MRRSAAPSQVLANSNKKPRFISPAKNCTVSLKNKAEYSEPEMENTQVNKRQVIEATPANLSSTISDSGSSGALTSHQAKFYSQKNAGKSLRLEDGVKSINETKIGPSCTAPADATGHLEEACCMAKYFSVVWCKASKKKHKTWEGDAVLIAKGRSVTLKDMESKDIGRGSGYKAKDLENLTEGQSLMVGSKEIEVISVITEEDFKSGRCFHSGANTGEDVLRISRSSPKPFCKPFKNVCKPSTKGNSSIAFQNCKPRHDPCAPNCLVMPHPSPNHQRMFNKSALPVVDVVVDPHLVNHLRPHQREGIIFLYECVMGMRVSSRFGAILADEMGLGKTLQCISLIWTLLRQGPYGCKPEIKQALIVTPGSLVKNWGKEFKKWLGNERIKVFLVDQDHKVEEFISSPLSSVLIISYEMFLRSFDQIQKTEFNLVICDEGHRLKNIAIKTTSALASLSCERRIILTGTPVQNDLQEFYALIEYVNPGILGPLSAYKKVYVEPILRSREPSATKEEIDLGERRAAELNRLTGLFILRRTQDVINQFLPPKREKSDSGKLKVLMQLLAAIHELSPSERVVLVSNYTQTLNLLQEMCKRCGYSYTRLDGRTPVSQRQQIVDGFNSKFCPSFIFLLSSKAGGVGLNLVGASHLILYDIDWNPATDIQAMARVWRDGQKRTVHIYRLLTTGTIEEKIYQRQISKQGLSGAVVDLSKGSEHIRFSLEELRNLFILHDDSSCVTHDLLECKCLEKKDDQSPSEKPSEQQDWQLVQTTGKPTSKKILSMSQLMEWKHFSGNQENLPDSFLERIKENVTFIFQNVST